MTRSVSFRRALQQRFPETSRQAPLFDPGWSLQPGSSATWLRLCAWQVQWMAATNAEPPERHDFL